jgi:hypothetical protein
MSIRLVEKERYSIMPPASKHHHDCRILESKDNRIRIKLDRTRDTRPPFFTVYDLSVRRPHPPTISDYEEGDVVCPHCGSDDVERRGSAFYPISSREVA